MSATPIVPGHSYGVKYRNTCWVIHAPNGAAAICTLIGMGA